MSADPIRNVAGASGGPETPPSGTRTKTPPLRRTAWADATCCSTPTPPRHTGSIPPSRCSSHSRQRALKADGPLPRNQTRGSMRQGVHDQERVHPATMDRRDEQVAARPAALGDPVLAGRRDLEPEGTEQEQRAPGSRWRGRSGWPSIPARDPARPGPPGPRHGRRRAPPATSEPRPPGARIQTDPGPARSAKVSRSGPAGADRARARGPARAPAGPRARLTPVVGTTRPSAPQVAISGNVGGSSSGCPRRVAPEQDHERRDDEPERHDLGDRQTVERPVLVAQRLEPEPDQPVPDEEREQQVARAQPLAQVIAHPDEDQERRSAPRCDSYRKSGWKRVVSNGYSRRTRGPRPGARNRSRCPTAAGSASRTAPG